jgi:hypothetical protein
MTTRNQFLFKEGDVNPEDKNIEGKIISLLKIKGKMTFSDMANELNFKNGCREILIDILFKMEAQGKIKKENVQIKTPQGINLTTCFFI